MPLYPYSCTSCHIYIERRVGVDERDDQSCACGQPLKRQFTVPHDAPIPGIYNRVNRNWNESGGTSIDEKLSQRLPK